LPEITRSKRERKMKNSRSFEMKNKKQSNNCPAKPIMPPTWKPSSEEDNPEKRPFFLTCFSEEPEIDTALKERGICLGECWLPSFTKHFRNCAEELSKRQDDPAISVDQFRDWVVLWAQSKGIARLPTSVRPASSNSGLQTQRSAGTLEAC